METLIACITALMGVVGLASSLQGHLFRTFPWWQRVIPFASSLLLIKAGIKTDLLGLALLCPFMLYQLRVSKKEKELGIPTGYRAETY